MSKKHNQNFKVVQGVFSRSNYIGIKLNNIALEKVTEELFAKSYSKIAKLVFEQGDKMPSAIYYNWDREENSSNMAIVLSIKDIPTNISEGFTLIQIPDTKSCFVDYFGLYTEMEPIHDLLKKYLIDNNLAEYTTSIEEYITDPDKEPDSSKWLTRISYLAL